MFTFRISQPAAEYSLLAQMGSTCSCGLVILMHGTGGAKWQTMSYAISMAGLGFVVVIPDSHAMPDEMGLKGGVDLLGTDQIATSNYCGVLNAYGSSCGSWSKPFCYSTKKDNILHDSAKYREYVERNYQIRKLELDCFVAVSRALLSAFPKVFLFGRSEGAMTAGRYYNEELFNHLNGLILSGWSCEYNYFVSCPQHAMICEGKCSTNLPVLNVNGANDAYFGGPGTGSVSDVVATNETHGYGGPLTGNCKAAKDAQGFAYGAVVEFPGVSHSIMYSHDNALRSIIADFLADPVQPASMWGSLQRTGCTLENGVYACDADSNDQAPCVGYVTNPRAPWVFRGTVMPCATDYPTCGAVKEAYRDAMCCGAPSKEFNQSVPTGSMSRRLQARPGSPTLRDEITKLLAADRAEAQGP